MKSHEIFQGETLVFRYLHRKVGDPDNFSVFSFHIKSIECCVLKDNKLCVSSTMHRLGKRNNSWHPLVKWDVVLFAHSLHAGPENTSWLRALPSSHWALKKVQVCSGLLSLCWLHSLHPVYPPLVPFRFILKGLSLELLPSSPVLRAVPCTLRQ